MTRAAQGWQRVGRVSVKSPGGGGLCSGDGRMVRTWALALALSLGVGVAPRASLAGLHRARHRPADVVLFGSPPSPPPALQPHLCATSRPKLLPVTLAQNV